ncbi:MULTISPECIES: hypothetical protein [unclassified Colwellia]|uniref:hypothetical protein n=1 Tax=unclassified Colwellia TaxID=196834 RepID=UPI0015F6B56D|nr:MULTISPECIES: hypothetical protein [unclassified Colwellia]MBA6356630.1 hypothetical protein [Colwellia sp. BRX8-3]MBA6360938.1 hypothetical protein [Colwellia sp. BRX8-6]MBA6368396.1 hypothetical protein [Colwellia sp. BRX8-5]MBA6377427.1 hypothetical protein [Colwellia sp. BRX8-2]
MTSYPNTINFQNFHFMEQLRKVELCVFDLYPEQDDSLVDWPFEDKVDFYIQAYALNALECLLNKNLTFDQFKAAFENNIVAQSKGTGEEFFYKDVRLFSKKISMDDNADMYYKLVI